MEPFVSISTVYKLFIYGDFPARRLTLINPSDYCVLGWLKICNLRGKVTTWYNAICLHCEWLIWIESRLFFRVGCVRRWLCLFRSYIQTHFYNRAGRLKSLSLRIALHADKWHTRADKCVRGGIFDHLVWIKKK